MIRKDNNILHHLLLTVAQIYSATRYRISLSMNDLKNISFHLSPLSSPLSLLSISFSSLPIFLSLTQFLSLLSLPLSNLSISIAFSISFINFNFNLPFLNIIWFDLQICNAVHSFLYFGMFSNHIWMVMEGLYLFLIILCTFRVEKLKFWHFGLIGWGKKRGFFDDYLILF